MEVALIGDVDVRFVPRGKELHHRRSLPADGKTVGAGVARIGRLACTGGSRAVSADSSASSRAGAGRAGPAHRPQPRQVRREARRCAGIAAIRRIAPPTSESFAQQAKIEVKPDASAGTIARTGNADARRAPANGDAGARGGMPPKPILASELPESRSRATIRRSGRAPSRDSDGLRLTFSFAAATPAALFRRADTVWLVFDSLKPIDIEPIRSQGRGDHRRRQPAAAGQGSGDPHSPQPPANAFADRRGSGGGANWTLTFADTMQTPPQPLAAIRNITDPALANVTVPLSKPGLLHRLVDPDAGDALMVVTAPLPVRGFIKRQDFVEMSLLESIHGVAVRPNSDDVTRRDRARQDHPRQARRPDAVIGRRRRRARAGRGPADFRRRRVAQESGRKISSRARDALIAAAAAAEPDQRTPARIDLARFYMSRGMYPEAKAVLDLALADAKPGSEDPVALIVHSVASSLMGRPEEGLKDLANPAIGTNYDSQLWKALAYARQGKWAEAREKFKNAEFAITSLPIELQRIVISEAMRASLEVKDYSGAAKRSERSGCRSGFRPK